MFNHIVTLSNVIAIIVLIEEKIFETPKKKLAASFFIFYARTAQHSFVPILTDPEELLMIDDQEVRFGHAGPLINRVGSISQKHFSFKIVHLSVGMPSKSNDR